MSLRYLSLFLLSVSVLKTVHLAQISFTNCGQDEIKYISIEPCPKKPCHFNKGSVANLTITFVASKPANKLTIFSSLRTGGFWDYELVLNPEDNQVCKSGNPATDGGKLDCPLQINKEYTFYFTREFPVSTSYNIFRYSKVKLTNENGENVICGDLKLEFQRLYGAEDEQQNWWWKGDDQNASILTQTDQTIN